MATLAEIREGLATNLATLPDVQVSPYMLGNPTPPTLQVMGPDRVEYDQAFASGLHIWHMIVQAFVGAVADQGAQVKLDQWIAPTGALSVQRAIESDRSLGGKVQDLNVQEASGYRIYTLDNRGAVLGCEWTVQVFT